MYEAFYGLRERPFELTPNPRFLCMTPQHREALATLEYGLSARMGIALLMGDSGTGKTTIVHAALQSESARRHRVVYLSNPALTRSEFMEFLANGFGLTVQAAMSKTRCLSELTEVLAEGHAAGTTAALVIDEAQCLSDELLEEIRLLANIESASEKLLSIVLVGQPELAGRLNHPALRQLKQRIGLRCSLPALTLAQTAAYIAARLRIAGGDADQVFTADAIRTVHEHSGGIPRTTSVICDNALVTGFALDRRPVDRHVVLDVCRDFDVERVIDAVDEQPIRRPTADEPIGARSGVTMPQPASPPLSSRANEPVGVEQVFFARMVKGRSA